MKHAVAITAASLAAATAAHAQSLDTQTIATGFTDPLFLTHAPGDDDRLFVVEQAPFTTDGRRGRVFTINRNTGDVAPDPYLAVAVSGGGERGLLGLAFHPEFQTNGFLYLNYTDTSGHTVIERYTQDPTDPTRALPDSAFTILRIPQPFANHNAGWLDFGPDGFLYIPTGDGGSSGDPQNNAQNTNNLLGAIVRIDVDSDDFPDDPNRNYAIPNDNPFTNNPAVLDEIWANGLRNPFRCAFDAATGDLYIADVGQDTREEISVQPASSNGGENYGWRCYEGSFLYSNTPADCTNPADLTFPVYQYNHDFGRGSITGGEVYRGCAIPSLQGTYFFADFLTGEVWSFKYDGHSSVTNFTDRTAELAGPGAAGNGFSITSFGKDALGEVYIVSRQNGTISRIVNADGSDNCPCTADTNNDQSVGLDDLLTVLSNFGSTTTNGPADGDIDPPGAPDNTVGLPDLLLALANFGNTCP